MAGTRISFSRLERLLQMIGTRLVSWICGERPRYGFRDPNIRVFEILSSNLITGLE